jgi:hypothetical protein
VNCRVHLFVAVLGILVSRFELFGWSGAGHVVIAAEAWRELSPAQKGNVTLLLKSHPDYSKWKSSFAGGSGDLDLPAFIFMRASTWPDEIRRHSKRYDHPPWHYIDYPLKPPTFTFEPAPSPDDDALFGIAQSEKVLSDKSVSPEERAVALSWLIHLIGDLHQPLHCASLFGANYPAGDKGGNEFFVMPARRGIKLHSFWDGLLGTSAKMRSQVSYAIQLQGEYPRRSLAELKTHHIPKQWSLESRILAIEKAYLNGQLKGGRDEDHAPALPEGYVKAAKSVAERQGALAGYRLADEIAKCLAGN